MAAAGHPLAALVLPDGSVRYADLVPGPPLGVGDNPFEVCSLVLPPGSVLVLYTDGLVGRDTEAGMDRLVGVLGTACRPGRSLEAIGADVVGNRTATDEPDDDVTLLLARTRAIEKENTVAWTYPADPAAVADVVSTSTQLEEWGLSEQAFATELIVSELVTNAIRYAGEPAVLRLIRNEQLLVCEVGDPSSTAPRLRRAKTTDEGGRGLFLIAQLADRWGSRYSTDGKTIWTEQILHPGF